MSKKKPVYTFVVDMDRMTMDDLIAVEEGLTLRGTRDFLARFVQNGSGTYLPFEEGVKVVGAMTFGEIREHQASLEEQMKSIQETAVPKE